ncbi:hypothetical protein ACHAO4_006001 [Trichoderma viride]
MALNSQFIASIFSARNENSFSLANASVDFALIRVEVPKQFEGLGNALSQRRRQNAESGSQHRIARRLGALFEQTIPNIDILTAAYGERASEIATSPLFDLKNADHCPFSGHVGVDGTSIYAAASSGKSIIALHLLACMLARMFSNVEATAIWMQLVDGRLKDLEQASETSQIQGLAALYAVEQGRQILRDDLASWDASARAWLQTANEVMKREDTQLKLIVKNIPSIHSSGTTYSNVVENWILAMKTTQDLIQGVPQDVTNGSVILGLMSWHIYPDLNVFSPNRDVKFHDRLVKPGGVITLGLEAKEKNCSGVSWSVSLSHLRFYGDPVVIEKRLEEDSDRITVEELRYISFGCVLGGWTQLALIDIEEAAQCFSALGDAVGLYNNSTDEKGYDSALGWITPLIDTANSFLSAVEKEREAALYFVEFGRRRGRNFLDDKFRNIIPMFGLLNPYLLFRLSPDFFAQRHDIEGSISHVKAENGPTRESPKSYNGILDGFISTVLKALYCKEILILLTTLLLNHVSQTRIGLTKGFTGHRMRLSLRDVKVAFVPKKTKGLVVRLAHVQSKGSIALHRVCAYQLLWARSEFYDAQMFEAASPPQGM